MLAVRSLLLDLGPMGSPRQWKQPHNELELNEIRSIENTSYSGVQVYRVGYVAA